jgi:hypothetical protein
MNSSISNAARPDVVTVESQPRPTPTPLRLSFGQVLAAGAGGLVQGAELVASKLPLSPLAAAAVRGPATVGPTAVDSLSLSTPAEGPVGGLSGASAAALVNGGLGTPGAGGSGTSIDASLQQSAQLNLYYLQVQEQVDAQNRSFTALSNVLKTEHDSAKAAIQNIHS